MSLRQDLRLSILETILKAWLCQNNPGRPTSIVDLGCQEGLIGESIRYALAARPGHVTAVDLWGPHVEAAKKHDGYHEAIKADARDYMASVVKGHHDIAIASELVEHMDKERGADLLVQMRDRCKLAVATAPLGWLAHGAGDPNPYEKHVSAWEPEDFTAAGYEVYALVPAMCLGVYVHADRKVRWSP